VPKFNKNIKLKRPRVEPCDTPEHIAQEEENFPNMRGVLLAACFTLISLRLFFDTED
jgi:hypothetical protein